MDDNHVNSEKHQHRMSWSTLSQALEAGKVQRLSREGVGNSVPEARGVRGADHDIVRTSRQREESGRKRFTRNTLYGQVGYLAFSRYDASPLYGPGALGQQFGFSLLQNIF
jgi:hypothetical protein